ncbi:MFS transporter [Nonomuraea spiralis]|uniref:MFS transporter n=1 Tax=Nonomuraea spiralis TaxID=46182 RepID=A0ABV5ILS5_9ACTN|nr:MFS transporter [Nonomuraea spiralis]GGT25739.1 MFS transporter [Nonomuraea spiralis]
MGKWGPLTAVSLGTFMLLVDVNIVTVAMPDMAASLKASFSSLQWVMDIYALALAALLLGAGGLADLLGRRRVYVVGLVTFAAASLASGLAPNVGSLIAARAIQGAGAAMMFATTVALIGASYAGRDRGVAFGVWGAVNGAASGIGPILGGLLTEQLGWRSTFLVNLPVSVAAVALTLRVVDESRNPDARRIDLPGIALFATAAGALVYALTRAGEDGWGSPVIVGTFAAAAIALAAFVAVEARSPSPILDLRLFRSPSFTGIMIASLAMSGAAFAYLMYTSMWLQSVQGLGALQAGLVILPIPAVSLVVSLLSGRFLHAVSPRWTIGLGMLLVGAGVAGRAVLTGDSGWAALVPGFAVVGVGVGVAVPNVTAATMASVPPERVGMAAGAVSTFRQLGFAVSVAVLGTVFRAKLQDALDHTVSEAAAYASGLNATFLAAGAIGLAAGAITLLLVRRPASAPAHQQTSQAALAQK